MAGTTQADAPQLQRSPWRWAAAAISLTVAAAHLPLIPEHLNEAPYIGLSFIGLEFAAVGLAIALVNWDTAGTWRAAVVVPALAVVAYLVTRTVALPEIADDKGNWTDPLGAVALSAEVLLVIVALGHRTPSWCRSGLAAHPRRTAAVVLLAGLVATGWAIVASFA